MLLGLRLHETRAGAVTASVTVSVNPSVAVIMIVVVPELPASISMKFELAEIPKSVAIGVTLTSTVAVCESERLVALIVTV